jgi:hypothetical protein
MIDATLSRVRMRDLVGLGRSRPARPETDEFMASII